MFFPISAAFEYVEIAINLFWPVVFGCAAFGIGYIMGGCAQRG